MSVRLTLLALSTLILSACDGNPLQTAARETCCCDRCPTTAAPAAPAAKPAKARPAETRTAARTVRVRHERTVVREDRGYAYSETVSSGYGGRYGATYAGGAVQQTGGYAYSESSSGYASGGGYGYAPVAGPCCVGGAPVPAPGPCCAPGGQGGPRGYRSASTDRDGYLTWPGKVED
ncbi:MAG: hypothetical protein K9G59_01940 [Caulobacter sp.]|nr:hypothetical protein [Caulobacter sp.]